MQVKIYTTKTCQWCRRTKEFFKAKNVQYTEVDVGVDQNAADAMVHKSGQMGVPVIEITDDDGKEHIVVGYDVEALTELLHLG